MRKKKILQSPWIDGLTRTRAVARLTHATDSDVAIIGAGIAGVTTAYFLLTRTNKSVVLLDAGLVAHGATGHNAGQITSYFERPFFDIAREFGLSMAAAGQHDIDSAWELLAEIRQTLQLSTPCFLFTGYAGCIDTNELITQLKNNACKTQAGISCEAIVVSETLPELPRLCRKYPGLFSVVPHATILNYLETNDKRYIAALAGKKGCLNSARFSEELVSALLQRYPKRLTLGERTRVSTITLAQDHAKLTAGTYTHTARRVVLCTNGFSRFTIRNAHGPDINTKFHHAIQGSIGYMAAFTETPVGPPTAISYLPKGTHIQTDGAFDAEPYYYLTRRPHLGADKKITDLICIGGPEAHLPTHASYKKSHPYPTEAKARIQKFVQRTYRHAKKQLRFAYLWHGLMGYTPNGIRCVGEEPCNPVLLYNLGCNGVGILPSIYGSSRIADLVQGKILSPSIFDPRDQRCIPPQSNTVLRTAVKQHRSLLRTAMVALTACWIGVLLIFIIALPFLTN